MTPRRSDAAERILREAMRLFAEKGYERTTIADIQAAAGLTPGSGALYKHFPSKEAVLRAGIEEFAEGGRVARELLERTPGTAADALAALGRSALELQAADIDTLRILWRELGQFPELRDAAREKRMQATYHAVAEWLREREQRGEVQVSDPDAAAVVILGGLMMFQLFEALLDEAPAQLDRDRYLRAWHELTTRGLGVEPAAGGPESSSVGRQGAKPSPTPAKPRRKSARR